MTGKRDSWYAVTFGLFLVLTMATVLFALVGINPKTDSYGSTPWIYSGLSAVGAAVFWVVSGRLSRPVGGL
jgi:hypothetical protein